MSLASKLARCCVGVAFTVLTFPAISLEEQAAPAPVELLRLPARAELPPQLACEALVARDFSRVPEGPARVQSAKIEAATGARAEFCLVSGYVAPTIRFELRLPTHGWTRVAICRAAAGVIAASLWGESAPPAIGAGLGGAFAVASRTPVMSVARWSLGARWRAGAR